MPDVSEARHVNERATNTALPEVVIGELIGLDEMGAPLVEWPGNSAGVPLSAISTSSIAASDVGRAVALLFANGDPSRPLVVGFVRQLLDETVSATETRSKKGQNTHQEFDLHDHGGRIVLSAEKEIVIRCGKASITLTRAGKIIERGSYILSRSSGPNKIKGGSIDLN